MTPEPSRPALLFIPDIGGFTRFVSGTALDHSRHIVEELLERIIDADALGLQVSEVEGDAVLFYRFGDPPGAEQLYGQIERMFGAFHRWLRRYERQRICRCGACTAATQLALKFVAHYGPVSRARIKERTKLFGAEVIAVHRLLKNGVPHREYALLTRALVSAWPRGTAPRWGRPEAGAETYDVGRVEFDYVTLAPLRAEVPEPRLEDYALGAASVRGFALERDIAAPMELVFEVVADLPARRHWIEGARRVELTDRGPNRLGMRHRCVVDATSPEVVTSEIVHAEGSIRFAETDTRGTGSAVWIFRRQGESRTRVTVEFLVRDSLPVRLLFALVLRRKLEALFRRSLDNLARYCAGRAREVGSD